MVSYRGEISSSPLIPQQVAVCLSSQFGIMARFTRRHLLSASLGLPALLLTCGPSDEASVKPSVPQVSQALVSPEPIEDVPRDVPSPVASPVSKEPVELWLFTWDDPTERRLWFNVRSQLEADLPHIRLRQEFYQRPVEETIAASAAAGLPPDVGLIQDMNFPHWLERNLFVNVQAFVNNSLGDDYATDKSPAALRAFRYYPEAKRLGIGDFYSLPWRSNPRHLFVNVGMLREYGSTVLTARNRWTIDTVHDAARSLARGSPEVLKDRAIIGIPNSWFQSLPWLWSGAGDLVDGDSSVTAIASPEVATTYQKLRDWRHSLHPTPQTGNASSDTYAHQFATQRLAMFLGSAGDMHRLQAADVTWQSRPLFPVGEGASQTLATYEGLAVATGAQQLDTAWEFVTWAMRPEVQKLLLDGGSSLPILGSAIASSQLETHYINTLLDGIHSQRSLPIDATFPLYSPVIAHYYQLMMNGEHDSIPDTLRRLHSHLEFILEQRTLPVEWQ